MLYYAEIRYIWSPTIENPKITSIYEFIGKVLDASIHTVIYFSLCVTPVKKIIKKIIINNNFHRPQNIASLKFLYSFKSTIVHPLVPLYRKHSIKVSFTTDR